MTTQRELQQGKIAGFDRTVKHLANYLTLSENEARRICLEVAHAISIGCAIYNSVAVPKLGTFWYNESGMQFKPSWFARNYPIDLEVDLSKSQFIAPTTLTALGRSTNQNDPTRESLCEYIKFQYPSELDWTTPKGVVFTYEQVKLATAKVRKLNDDYFDVFVTRMLSTRRRYTIASAFIYSEASIKRRCDAVIASILLLLIHPDLTSDSVAKLYRN